jgi:transcriptional regulator with GAF, ATPase, and Fis domain
MMNCKELRSDLYYRLNVFPIALPPLRDRREDIAPLVEHYVEMFCHRTGKSIHTIPLEFMDACKSYSWPGNIRELQNVIERAVILSNDGVIPNLLPTRTASIIGFPVTTRLSDSERTLILSALEASGWVVGGPYGAAARLGLKRTTLVARMKKHGILRPSDERNVGQALNNKLSSNRVC